jgi:hypothetical protein
MGKHKYIETPEKMWELFVEYKNSVKNNPAKVQDYVGKDAEMVYREKELPISWDGFEIYVMENGHISYPDLSEYAEGKNESYKDYFPLCCAIKKYCRVDQINGGMIGIYNPSITQRLNGLTDKSEVRHIEQPLFPDN